MATADTGTGATQPARHVLAVYAHPWAHSFTGFILHSAVRGVRAAGHSVEIADLYAEGFDPLLRHEDYAPVRAQADAGRRAARAGPGRAIRRPHVRLPRVVVVVPGHAQRLVRPRLVRGWAYSFTPERSRGLLTYRPVLMLCVAGSRYVTYEKYGYDQAMRTQIDIGVMSYAGLHDVRSQFFYEVDDDPGSHEEHLRLAYDLGKTFLATERA